MKSSLLVTFLSTIILNAFSQISINSDGAQPDPSAILDIQSTNKGLLIPQLTTQQMDLIENPATGLLVFNSDSVDIYMFNGLYWLNIRKNSNPIYPGTYFECGWEIDYAGQSYSTVQIGTQCWMAENLNVGTMLPGGTPSNDGIIEKFCYSNTAANCTNYGGLYTWDEMMQYTSGDPVQGICPPGWHIPGEAEWCTMTTFVDSTVVCNIYAWTGTNAGLKLRSTSGWYSGWNGTNEVGFNGLPGGSRTAAGDYFDLTTYGNWWSSQPTGSNAWNRRVTCYQNDLGSFYNTKTYALSVRCIKD
jgi:uncharacterized protein (TIGR02145 family)